MSPNDTDMLQALRNWFTANQPDIHEQGLTGELHDSPRNGHGKQAVYLDIDAPKSMARIIVWNTGEGELTMLDIDSGENLLVEHHEFRSASALDAALNRLVNIMASAE